MVCRQESGVVVSWSHNRNDEGYNHVHKSISDSEIAGDHSLRELIKFIRSHCLIQWSEAAPILSSGGKKFRWIFDFWPLLLDGEKAQTVAELFWDRFEKLWPFQIAGIELTAVPLITAIALEGVRRGCKTPALIIRKKRSKNGRMRLVEGEPNDKLPVVIVDDAINSGRSMNQALVAIRDLGLRTEYVFAIVHFNSQGAQEWCSKNKLMIHHLVTPQDFDLQIQSRAQCKTEFQLVWTFASSGVNYRFAVAKSTPVLHNDCLLFGSDSGIFWCLEALTGRIRWSHRTGDKTGKGIVSSPVVIDGKVYFGSYSGWLYCLEAESGKEVWSNKSCDWIGSSPCYANGSIYIGLEFKSKEKKGSLAKFSASTGELEWQVFTDRQLHGSPVYSKKHNAIVLGTNDSTVLVVDAISGRVARTLTVGGPIKYHCALHEDLAVFGSFDGKIYVWDFVADEIRLEVQTNDIVYSRPLILNDRAFIGSADHSFVVIDLKRFCEIRRFDIGEKVHSSPALIGGTLYFGTSSGELIGMDPNSLDITHRYQFPERLTNTLVSDGTRLYVYAYDNKMWAILPKP
jgi:outer membrane protein assembly factor BamB